MHDELLNSLGTILVTTTGSDLKYMWTEYLMLFTFSFTKWDFSEIRDLVKTS